MESSGSQAATPPADGERFLTPRVASPIVTQSRAIAAIGSRLQNDDSLRALVVIGGIPNLVLLPLAVWGSRAVINGEYLLIAAVERYVSRAMLAVLLGIALMMDVAITLAPVFNFGPTEIVAAVQQIVHFRGRAVVTAVGIALLIAALGVLLVRMRGTPRVEPADSWRQIRLCGAVAGAAFALDVANGTSAVLWRANAIVGVDVATSMVASDYVRGIGTFPNYGQQVDAATDALRLAVQDATKDSWAGPNKIVLVVLESMGLPKATSADEMWAPFMNPEIARRYEVRTGKVAFSGATTAGEFRELCGIRMTHMAVGRAPLPPCLPGQLKSLGYETFSLHGYNGMLFQRLDWYPLLGFDRLVFDDQLSTMPGMVKCGRLFHGACDSSAVAVVRNELTRNSEQRQFVYWLTLSTHFPLGKPDHGSEGCRAVGSSGRIPLVCQLWTALWPSLTGLAKMAADTSVPPAWYIIVGDHVPPQILGGGPNPSSSPRDRQRPNRFQESRLAFSTTDVPYLELRPRRR